MPEEENSGGEKKESGGGGLMSTKGWIVVVAVVLIEAVFFGVLLHLQSKQAPEDDSKPGAAGTVPIDDIAKVDLVLDRLTYSKLSAGGSMQTLVMEITIQLGPSDKERAGEVILSDDDWTKIGAALNKLKPEIKADLVAFIDKQTVSTLSTPRGKELIANRVKDFVRERFKKLDLGLSQADADPDRDPTVLITDFMIQ